MKRPSFFGDPALVVVFVLLITGIVQLWLITDSFMWRWPRQTTYYPALTDAFVHGQLSLRIKPRPELLALPDPYDPVANAAYQLHDAVLFDGKYYLYWGPVPALIPVVISAVTGVDPSGYCDQQLVFAFTLGTVMMATILMLRARKRFYPQLSAWVVLPPALTLGLGAPLLNCGGVYGAAIIAGQFFLLAGLWCACCGLCRKKTRYMWMIAAGICWALSCGSRVSLPPAIGAVAILTILQLRRMGTSNMAVVALLAPLLGGGALMGWYNFARFGSVTDFGYQYMVGGYNPRTTPKSEIVSARYFIPNLTRYLVEPPQWSGHFPYVKPRDHTNESGIDTSLHMSGIYMFDTVAGEVWTQPFLAFAACAFVAARRRNILVDAGGPEWLRARWLVGSLCAAAALGIAPPLFMAGTAFRYLDDALPSVAVMAAMGYFQVLSVSGRWRRGIEIGAMFLVIVQSLLGILMATDKHHAIAAIFGRW